VSGVRVPRAALARAGIGSGDLAGAGWELMWRTGRHAVLIARDDNGEGVVVKRARDGRGRADLEGERAVLDALARCPELAGTVPRTVPGAPGDLVTRPFPGRPLNERRDLPAPETMCTLGRVLAAAHRVPAPHRHPPGAVRRMLPWALRAHRPDLETLLACSTGAQEACRIIQSDTVLATGLDRLAAGWRWRALIHGDVKADNVLIDDDGRVALVDWEFAGIGDPSWDAGSAVAMLLRRWIDTVPVAAGVPGPRGLMEGLLDPEAGRASPAREAGILAMAAARLVQDALERSNVAHRPPPEAVLSLQVAHNILLDPLGARELAGLAD